MELPRNVLKASLASGIDTFGTFSTIGSAVSAEIAAASGCDWVIIDAEHGPNSLPSILGQLHALSGYDCSAIVRPPTGDTAIIKQLLDLGAQSLLIPMVNDAELASAMAAAVEYPPHGVRGIASARAARWGTISDYFFNARREILLIVQLETEEALANLESICAVVGVDAVFVGPSDLAGALGHIGDPGHPEVVAAVSNAIARAVRAGKPAGTYASTIELAQTFLREGASFVAAGVDAALLSRATATVLQDFRTVAR